ncbi:MAG: hypothetical protein Q8P25_00735 [Candidatus Curtissbacteria bacterium]|nr:hypothetical protein [Candidatus Curtissbacteria bacterium]MDZ4209692.1 hypothetical protein [Candidatus Curtissbacteria bacterium]
MPVELETTILGKVKLRNEVSDVLKTFKEKGGNQRTVLVQLGDLLVLPPTEEPILDALGLVLNGLHATVEHPAHVDIKSRIPGVKRRLVRTKT